MNRLTYKHDDKWCISGLNGKLISDKHANYWGEAIDRLAYYENLKEQNRLAIIPCNIGDTVYQPSYKFTACSACNITPRYKHDMDCEDCCHECDSECYPFIYEGRVCEFMLNSIGEVLVGVQFKDKWDTSRFKVGDGVFLTLEEAEEALKGKWLCFK